MNFISKMGLWGKRHAPEILMVGSIASLVTSLVFTGIATSKVKGIVEPSKEELKGLRNELKQVELLDDPNKNELAKPIKKELAKTYLKTGGKVLWVYAPAVLTASLSVACILTSHHIMKARYLALSSAYTILDNSLRAYRSRVRNKLGEEVEDKLFRNVTKEKVKYTDENGEKRVKSVEVEHHNEDEDFVVMYDCPCNNWSKDALDNFNWLMLAQDYFNNRLRRRGYVTLWEVYSYLGFTTKMLGARKATASRYLGWVYDERDPNRNNYISFGLTYPGTRQALPKTTEQISLNEPSFWLSFNVDGDILSENNNPNYFVNFVKEDGE